MRKIPRADEIEIRQLIGKSRRLQRLSTGQKARLVQILSARYDAPCWAIRSLMNMIELERLYSLSAVDGDAPPEPAVSWAELRAAMNGEKVWAKR
jgi:hypothetical protein